MPDRAGAGDRAASAVHHAAAGVEHHTVDPRDLAGIADRAARLEIDANAARRGDAAAIRDRPGQKAGPVNAIDTCAGRGDGPVLVIVSGLSMVLRTTGPVTFVEIVLLILRRPSIARIFASHDLFVACSTYEIRRLGLSPTNCVCCTSVCSLDQIGRRSHDVFRPTSFGQRRGETIGRDQTALAVAAAQLPANDRPPAVSAEPSRARGST